MERNELIELADYVNKVADNIPAGLSHLKDAVSFACIEIRMYLRTGCRGKDYHKALEFAQSIPKDDDLDSNEMISWKLHNKDFLKYMP